MCEPVTLPGWDLRDPQTREEAHNYIDSQAPDLLVLAWPCSPWSTLQNLNCRTPEAVRRLAQKRNEHRPMLEFVGEAVRRQRARGGAVLGENPRLSKAWQEPAIVEGFKGMAETVSDMCQFGLRKPAGEGARRFMKKPTRLVGTPEVIRRCSRRCKGSHKHTHIFGNFKWRGKWRSLSEFAGGYTPDFAQEVVIGAEEYLKGTRRPEIFVEGTHVPEERFEEFENEEEVVPEEDLEQRMLQEELEEMSREEQVPEEAQRQQKQTRDRLRLMMVHRRLGHPSPETLERMLRLAGAEGQLLKECRELQCPVCEASQAPRKPIQQAPSMRPVTFNASVHLDLKYAKDCKSKLYVALSMIDHATNFHRACLLRTRRPVHVANKFVTQWCALFGDPTELVFDQGGEFEKEFLFELEKRAIHSKVVGAYAPWQNSFAERQGALLGAAWHALIVEYKAEDYTTMKQSLAAAVQAKNATVSRRGYSANALVFGRPANFPDLLDDDVQDRTTLGQALNLEGEFSRAMEMRAAARRALLHQDVQAKLKKALLRRPGGEAIPFLPGQRIYFWVPGPKNVRYKRDRSGWRGPATVMVREGEERYFVSWRGRCLLLSAANMRPATAEEAGDMVRLELDAQEAIQELEKMKSFQDATSWRPPFDDIGGRPWQAQDVVMVPKSKKGRPYNEAKEMMRGLKSVRKVIRHPLFRKRMMAKRRQRQKQQLKQKAPEEKPVEPEPRGGMDIPVPEGGSDYEPTSPRSSPSPDFWPTVQQIEKWYDEIDDEVISDHSDSPRVRRRRSLDDVPDPIRQKRPPEEKLSEEQIRKKFKGEFFQTVMVATAVEDFPAKHKGKVNLPLKERGKANAWLPRTEVKKLRRLLDLPITAARLHKQPRKRMQRPPGGKKRGRVVVMLSKQAGAAMVSQETLEEVRQQPRRKAPFLWRGMTLFTKPEEAIAEENMAYVQLEEEFFQVKVTQPQAWREMVEREKKLEALSEALILKLKSSGKELDPRLFDKDEAAAFAESDKNEWESWIKNKVIERINPDVARQVDRSLVFRAPLRMVRTNKSKEAMKLIAKSRLVVPGHLDPQLGDYRTDSPTVASVAVRMTKIICAMKKWSGWFFDVSTAFLSGKNATRQILVKAPPEGLPAVDGMKAVRPQELMRIVKSAYGLPEAPRLWYLRAVELLEEGGMQEVPFARSTFVLVDPKKTVRAICDLHVDDGFLVGEEGEFHFEKLKQYINEHFNIKEWSKLGEKPVRYLGMDVTMGTDGIQDNMVDYIRKIEYSKLTGPDEKMLESANFKEYRRLVMQMRWPAAHVMPDFLYRISALAQKFKGPSYADVKKANKTLKDMKALAESGGAILKYPNIGGEVMFVTYFDASLGKEEKGQSQQGAVHFITSVKAETQPSPAGILEFNSSRISRVVRSSMAAEAASMTMAADHQLYNRLLWEALTKGQLEVHGDWRQRLTTRGLVVTDAKSLYDHVKKVGHLTAERQTALDLHLTKQMVEKGILGICWCPTFKQYADALTKEMDTEQFTVYRQFWELCMKQTEQDKVLEERRALLRRGQRERRKLRMSAA